MISGFLNKDVDCPIYGKLKAGTIVFKHSLISLVVPDKDYFKTVPEPFSNRDYVVDKGTVTWYPIDVVDMDYWLY